MYIKRVSKDEMDIFWGTGWDNWARFRIEYNPETHQKYLRQEKGIEVPKPVMAELLARFVNRKPSQHHIKHKETV